MAKRKNIKSAIHNWAHSFMSIENYDEKGYFVKELYDSAKTQRVESITINVLAEEIFPTILQNERICPFIEKCRNSFFHQLMSQNVEPKMISSAKLEIKYDFSKPLVNAVGFVFRDAWRAPDVAIYKTEIMVIDDLQAEYQKEIPEWWQ